MQVESEGCERVFVDNCSGAVTCVDRPQLQQMCAQLRAGDVIVLWKLDNLGHNLRDLLTFVSDIEGGGIEVVSLTEQMDTTTMGWLVFQIFGALAEHERNLISERTKGRCARLPGVGPQVRRPQVSRVAKLLRAGQLTMDEICTIMRIGRTTPYRYITSEGEICTEPRL